MSDRVALIACHRRASVGPGAPSPALRRPVPPLLQARLQARFRGCAKQHEAPWCGRILGSETQKPRLTQRSRTGAPQQGARFPVPLCQALAGGVPGRHGCFSNPQSRVLAVRSLGLLPAGGPARPGTPIPFARPRLRPHRCGLERSRATWLILPVAYACLKD